MYFLISVHYVFQKRKSLEPRSSTPGYIEIFAQWVFSGKFNYVQLLVEVFFVIIDILESVQRKVNYCLILVHHNMPTFPMITFFTWSTLVLPGYSFLFSLTGYHVGNFTRNIFLSRPNKTWDIGEKLNLGRQKVPQLIMQRSWRVGTFRCHFSLLPWHIFTKFCFPS